MYIYIYHIALYPNASRDLTIGSLWGESALTIRSLEVILNCMSGTHGFQRMQGPECSGSLLALRA